MIDITKRSSFKYLLFGSLYFSEGLIKSISAVILPIYFLEKGVPPELITLVIGIAAFPMMVKFIWGGITDYFVKISRKRFILIGGLLSAFSLFVLTFIDPGVALILFAFLIFISWCGVGFLDVSSDAMAIEISSVKERGKINGSMFFGQNFGVTVGAIMFPMVKQVFSYNMIFLTAGLIVLLIIIFPLLIKEVKRVKKHQKIAPLVIGEFKKKTTLLIAIFTSLITMSSGMLFFIVPLYMKINFKLDLNQIGLITAILTIAMAIGSLIGGVITDRWGRKNTLYTFIIISIILTASLIITNSWQNFAILLFIVGFLQGGYHAAFLAMIMDITNPKIGATQFSILTGLGNFGLIAAGSFSGTLYAIFGFSRVFLYSAWIFGPPLLVLYFIRFKKIIKKMQ
jgi:MFS family permease